MEPLGAIIAVVVNLAVFILIIRGIVKGIERRKEEREYQYSIIQPKQPVHRDKALEKEWLRWLYAKKVHSNPNSVTDEMVSEYLTDCSIEKWPPFQEVDTSDDMYHEFLDWIRYLD